MFVGLLQPGAFFQYDIHHLPVARLGRAQQWWHPADVRNVDASPRGQKLVGDRAVAMETGSRQRRFSGQGVVKVDIETFAGYLLQLQKEVADLMTGNLFL